jgi:hypothetical protein
LFSFLNLIELSVRRFHPAVHLNHGLALGFCHTFLRLAISNTFWISDTLASFHHSAVRFNIGRADSAMRDEGLQYPFLTLDR